MKKITFKFFLVLFACLSIAFLLGRKQKPNAIIVNVPAHVNSELPEADNPDLLQEQEFEKIVDRKLGYVPTERLIAAKQYAEQVSENNKYKRSHAAIAGITWTERGPDNVGGRTAALMVDPNDATHKSVFSAGVDGGLWKTTDITVAAPVWTAVNNFFANLAITTIAYNPASTTTMYFGTGEGWFNLDAVQGAGIWKSTDGGVTWTQLAATTNSNFYFVQKIVVDAAGNVYAATRSSFCNGGGLYRSTDGGVTWNLVLGVQGGSCATSNCWASDVEIAANGTLYASLGINSPGYIYSSTTGNAGSWTQLNTGANGFPAPTAANYERLSIGCAPSSAATVYVLCESTATQGLYNIYKTINSGATWTTCGLPAWQDQCAAPVSDFTRGQAWYDLSVGVDPANANNVFIGGVDIMKSTDGGTSWTQVTDWSGACYPYVHADQHTIVFAPGSSSTVYFGNDGGFWATTNATAVPASIVITNKNSGYNVTQFYSVAMNPTSGSNDFLCGAQDNGCQAFSTAGMNATTQATGGDGAFCHIDQLNPTYQLTSYVYLNYYVSTNGGTSFNSVSFGNNGSFINPSDFDNTAKILYSSYNAGQYHRWMNPELYPAAPVSSAITIAAFGGNSVTSVTVSPNTANRVFFGLSNGNVVRVDNANGGAPTGTSISTGLPNATVSHVAVETGNDNHLMVTYSNYGTLFIGESFNGGTTWTNDVGNLPDMPVRWVMFNPSINTEALIATEVGVWSTTALTGATTNWGTTTTGEANVRTDMLQYRASDGLIAAATHGRGMFTTTIPGPLPVSFLSFTGASEPGGNLLKWSTATETNCEKFEVQRSQNGEDFIAIGDVQGAGTSSVEHNYSFTDNSVSTDSLYYYRLRQIDFDGNYQFSNIIALSSSAATVNPISVFPNPFISDVTAKFISGTSGAVVNLYDLSGRLIYNTIFSGTELNMNFAKQNLSCGIYILNITVNGGQAYNFRIVKL